MFTNITLGVHPQTSFMCLRSNLAYGLGREHPFRARFPDRQVIAGKTTPYNNFTASGPKHTIQFQLYG